MTTPTFLVAKYVPNLSRMEPRNIGVILWANGKIRARFLSQTEATFVDDKDAFQSWVSLWSGLVSASSIQPRSGKAVPVPVSDSEAMKALLTHQEAEFLLVDAGELLENIRAGEHQAALDYLYSDLVANRTAPVDDRNFERHCDRIIALANLDSREDFHRKYGLTCEVFGVERHFQISYGLGNGHPDALLQRVIISSARSVDSTALMLHAFTERQIVSRDRTAALISPPPSPSPRESEAIQFLRRVTRVIDVSDVEKATFEVREVAKV